MDPNHLPRFRPGLAAAAVAFFRPADFAAAQRRFVAAMIRARPSGIRRRSFLAAFAGAGVAGARRGSRCAWGRRPSHDPAP